MYYKKLGTLAPVIKTGCVYEESYTANGYLYVKYLPNNTPSEVMTEVTESEYLENKPETPTVSCANKKVVTIEATKTSSDTITVSLPIAVQHGMKIEFITPCDCTGITTLKIGSTDYKLYDKLGNALGSGGDFTTDAIVTVEIDAITNSAYLQNAIPQITPNLVKEVKAILTGEGNETSAISPSDNIKITIGTTTNIPSTTIRTPWETFILGGSYTATASGTVKVKVNNVVKANLCGLYWGVFTNTTTYTDTTPFKDDAVYAQQITTDSTVSAPQSIEVNINVTAGTTYYFKALRRSNSDGSASGESAFGTTDICFDEVIFKSQQIGIKSVQKGTYMLQGANAGFVEGRGITITIEPVNPNKTFVLIDGSTTYNSNDYPHQLHSMSPTSITIWGGQQSTAGNGTYQVVEFY